MKSFKYAFRGIFETVRSERNMRVHLCFALYVVTAGFVTQLTAPEWAAVLVCIGAVTALECFNTALERLCDTLCPEKNEGIRRAKDAAAGAVLCAALASAAVGADIFFRADRFAAALGFFKNNTVIAVLIILALIPLCFFVRGGKRDRE